MGNHRITLEPVVLDTHGWITAARAYLDEMEKSIPIAERREHEALTARLGREPDEEERVDIGSKFSWFPHVLSYSMIMLLHTIVETQLTAFANRLRQLRNLSLKVNDIRGDPIERTKLYLEKVAEFKVSTDLAWEELRNLAKLRNIIVHRRGLLGPNEEERKTARMLAEKYSGALSISGPPDRSESEVEVSTALCRSFLDTIEGFFNRMFQASGFPKDGFTVS